MKNGLYLTTWKDGDQQISLVKNMMYHYVYVTNTMAGYIDSSDCCKMIEHLSTPISKKRVILLGWGEHLVELLKFAK